MNDSEQQSAPVDTEDLRPHTYDGIEEYDKCLPNWWLWTLFGAIIYSVAYWMLFHQLNLGSDPGAELIKEMKHNALTASQGSEVLSGEQLWKLSRETSFTSSGRLTVLSSCAACHKPDLSGGIGPCLTDKVWVHGGSPSQILDTITNGVPAKGMPAWGPILGRVKINEVTAYLLSFQEEPATSEPEQTTAQK